MKKFIFSAKGRVLLSILVLLGIINDNGKENNK